MPEIERPWGSEYQLAAQVTFSFPAKAAAALGSTYSTPRFFALAAAEADANAEAEAVAEPELVAVLEPRTHEAPLDIADQAWDFAEAAKDAAAAVATAVSAVPTGTEEFARLTKTGEVVAIESAPVVTVTVTVKDSVRL
jgi:hypothetical protein